jgi:hypothetical protein
MVQCSFFVGGRFHMFAKNSGPEFLVGDLQLKLNLQCVVMKNDEEGLIDNFVHCYKCIFFLTLCLCLK